MKKNILISGCLLGLNCRYDGTGKMERLLETYKEEFHFIPVCPEILGGLSTPREPAERQLDRVLTIEGQDVTLQYEKGAQEVLKLAKFYNCNIAILKERSPSCGSKMIYDGSFKGIKIKGLGVTSELLKANGIAIWNELEIEYILKKIKEI